LGKGGGWEREEVVEKFKVRFVGVRAGAYDGWTAACGVIGVGD